MTGLGFILTFKILIKRTMNLISYIQFAVHFYLICEFKSLIKPIITANYITSCKKGI